ncbi:hypothetical protein Thein_0194 [Thermodesulfatator indicus DSM 15286]|uniref:DUF2802 domain-containing protein n=1 Tax=Thermodesulfatator indicus (strain DSM 15286 / JCM 11887 / CIR29812) TaxID=667014 RepID=F8A9D8_THEID|nr:hypothetical protein [Thermodesulfatator indicus]AEH44079.1 hypothetical protein Thein_0194 [Thermodesulfatator indicus DSM 15286]
MFDITLFFLFQAIFDLILLLLLFLLYLQLRRLGRIPLDEVEKRLKAANELCEKLSENLAQKKELSEKIITALETGADAWESTRKDAQDIKSKVYEMAKKGLDVSEIAKKTGLQEGEVNLILAVKKDKV